MKNRPVRAVVGQSEKILLFSGFYRQTPGLPIGYSTCHTGDVGKTGFKQDITGFRASPSCPANNNDILVFR